MTENKIFKKTSDLELEDISKRWFWTKVLKWLLIGISIILLVSTMTLYWNPIVKIRSLLVKETRVTNHLDSNFLEFLGYSYIFMHENKKLNDTNFLQFCKYLKISHPYETTAQHMYESGNFNINTSSARWNNTGGFMTASGYMKFKHWTDCIYFTKKFQEQHGLKKGMNYYAWINNVNYHEADKNIYTAAVQEIERNLRKKFPQ